jgi:hypothetical protein
MLLPNPFWVSSALRDGVANVCAAAAVLAAVPADTGEIRAVNLSPWRRERVDWRDIDPLMPTTGGRWSPARW